MTSHGVIGAERKHNVRWLETITMRHSDKAGTFPRATTRTGRQRMQQGAPSLDLTSHPMSIDLTRSIKGLILGLIHG